MLPPNSEAVCLLTSVTGKQWWEKGKSSSLPEYSTVGQYKVAYRLGWSNFFQPGGEGIKILALPLDYANSKAIGNDMMSTPITSRFWFTQQTQSEGCSGGQAGAFLSPCHIVPVSPSPKKEGACCGRDIKTAAEAGGGSGWWLQQGFWGLPKKGLAGPTWPICWTWHRPYNFMNFTNWKDMSVGSLIS